MPVAVVEALQVMRVEAVAEVGGEAERLEGARFPEAAGDGVVAIDLLPGALVAGGELLRRHVARLKDDVLAVVQLPVARKNAVLGREPLVQRRSRKRRQDGEARQVDAVVDREIGGDVEDVERDRDRVRRRSSPEWRCARSCRSAMSVL